MNACVCSVWKPRIRTKSNGSIVVAKQCLACGRSLGELPKADHNLDSLERWDDALLQSTLDKRNAEFELARELNAAKLSDWWRRYNFYLTSEHWRSVRHRVLERDRMCQVCFQYLSQHAHHLSYDSFNRYGVSFAVECVGVCTTCHEKLHLPDPSIP